MKLSEIQEINGKKLTQPQKNLLAKLETVYGINISSEIPQPRANRFSGATTAPVHPVIGALIDFVYDCNTGFGPVTHNGKKVAIGVYDSARYLVLALDQNAYSATLD